MNEVYRQGNHSPVNVWMEWKPGPPEGPETKVSEHIAMATNERWASAICEALNAQADRERANLPRELDAKERAIRGLELFVHALDMGATLDDFPPDLIDRLWTHLRKAAWL